jgi:hypothetical protein
VHRPCGLAVWQSQAFQKYLPSILNNLPADAGSWLLLNVYTLSGMTLTRISPASTHQLVSCSNEPKLRSATHTCPN